MLKKVQACPHGSCNSVDIWSVTHVTTLSRKERVPRLKLGNLLICSQLLCPWAIPPEINPRLYYRDAVSQLVVGFISATWLNSTRQKQFGPAGFRKWAGNSSPSCQPAYALLEQDTKNQTSSRIYFPMLNMCRCFKGDRIFPTQLKKLYVFISYHYLLSPVQKWRDFKGYLAYLIEKKRMLYSWTYID